MATAYRMSAEIADWLNAWAAGNGIDAVELVGMGYADTVIPLGAARQLIPRLAPDATWVSLRPRQYDMFAIVHRSGASLSPAARLMIELATKRIQEIADPLTPRGAATVDA